MKWPIVEANGPKSGAAEFNVISIHTGSVGGSVFHAAIALRRFIQGTVPGGPLPNQLLVAGPLFQEKKMARSSLSVNAAIILVVAMVSITYQHASGVQNQAEMYKAAAKSYAGADTDLNQAYIRLSKALEPEPRAKLKKAELAWLKFRDAEGEFRASEFKGGAMQPMARLGYLEDLTRRRSQELKNAYKQFVAD